MHVTQQLWHFPSALDNPFVCSLAYISLSSAALSPSNTLCAGVGGSFPSALNDLANGKNSTVMPTRSAAKLENLAALEMPFELKALEVCLDSVSSS
jgi:hypothetical protein